MLKDCQRQSQAKKFWKYNSGSNRKDKTSIKILVDNQFVHKHKHISGAFATKFKLILTHYPTVPPILLLPFGSPLICVHFEIF